MHLLGGKKKTTLGSYTNLHPLTLHVVLILYNNTYSHIPVFKHLLSCEYILKTNLDNVFLDFICCIFSRDDIMQPTFNYIS